MHQDLCNLHYMKCTLDRSLTGSFQKTKPDRSIQKKKSGALDFEVRVKGSTVSEVLEIFEIYCPTARSVGVLQGALRLTQEARLCTQPL